MYNYKMVISLGNLISERRILPEKYKYYPLSYSREFSKGVSLAQVYPVAEKLLACLARSFYL